MRTTVLAMGAVSSTPERTAAVLVVAVVIEHDERQPELALPPPRAGVPALVVVPGPAPVPDAEAIEAAAVEACARVERSERETVRPGLVWARERVSASRAA